MPFVDVLTAFLGFSLLSWGSWFCPLSSVAAWVFSGDRGAPVAHPNQQEEVYEAAAPEHRHLQSGTRPELRLRVSCVWGFCHSREFVPLFSRSPRSLRRSWSLVSGHRTSEPPFEEFDFWVLWLLVFFLHFGMPSILPDLCPIKGFLFFECLPHICTFGPKSF